MKIATVGIDLANNVFQVHAVDERGRAALRKQLRRDQMTASSAIVGYTSQPTWPPDNTGSTSLLGPQQSALSVVGQSYFSLTSAGALLAAGRSTWTRPK